MLCEAPNSEGYADALNHDKREKDMNKESVPQYANGVLAYLVVVAVIPQNLGCNGRRQCLFPHWWLTGAAY